MCSNYRPPKSEALAQLGIGLLGFEYSECYPGSLGPFLASLKPDAWLPGTFGLLPHWAEPKLAKMTYNARSETVAEKPSFRNAWRHRQLAVIPVQAFFEPCYESGKAVRCASSGLTASRLASRASGNPGQQRMAIRRGAFQC